MGSFLPLFKVTDITFEKDGQIGQAIVNIRKILSGEVPETEIGFHCREPFFVNLRLTAGSTYLIIQYLTSIE